MRASVKSRHQHPESYPTAGGLITSARLWVSAAGDLAGARDACQKLAGLFNDRTQQVLRKQRRKAED